MEKLETRNRRRWMWAPWFALGLAIAANSGCGDDDDSAGAGGSSGAKGGSGGKAASGGKGGASGKGGGAGASGGSGTGGSGAAGGAAAAGGSSGSPDGSAGTGGAMAGTAGATPDASDDAADEYGSGGAYGSAGTYGAAGTSGADGAVGASGAGGVDGGCTQLKVKNFLGWCSVAVDGGTFQSSSEQTVCVAPGTVALAARPQAGFALGDAPWHETDGDAGYGDQGTVSGDTSSTTITVGTSATCVWVCCDFPGDGGGCPTTNQCP